jgi:glycosidase
MVDFVPNHSATDAPEIPSQMRYYVRAPPGTTDPSRYLPNGIAYGCGQWCSPWTDVAQLNYMDRDLRAFRISQMKAIASVADGMRCDMAHLLLNDAFWSYWQTELTAWGYSALPTEFWADAIAAVRADFPDCVFMAESYGDVLARLHALGFDYAYDKDPLDRLRDGDVAGFKALLCGSNETFKRRLAHFTENHDEPRAVETFRGNVTVADAAAAALLTWPGLRFVNQGQEEGFARRIDVHLRRALPEPVQPAAVEFYAKLFAVLNTTALRGGEYTLKSIDGSDTILTWEWAKGEEHVLVCVNFSPWDSGGNVVCGDAPLSGDTIPVTDLMTGTVYQRDPNVMRTTGLTIVLAPYQVQIMKY